MGGPGRTRTPSLRGHRSAASTATSSLSRGSTTTGRGSYSTSTRSAASAAAWIELATTIATGSPTKRVSVQRHHVPGRSVEGCRRRFPRSVASRRSGRTPSARKSRPLKTPRTPSLSLCGARVEAARFERERAASARRPRAGIARRRGPRRTGPFRATDARPRSGAWRASGWAMEGTFYAARKGARALSAGGCGQVLPPGQKISAKIPLRAGSFLTALRNDFAHARKTSALLPSGFTSSSRSRNGAGNVPVSRDLP